MKVVHFILQCKGGVGKTFIATLLAEYLSQYDEVAGFDTYPDNTSFEQYFCL